MLHIYIYDISRLRVKPYALAAFTPRKYSWYSFLLEAECGRKDYVNEKIPIKPSEIERATYRLVSQCLNQLRHQQRTPAFKAQSAEMRERILTPNLRKAEIHGGSSFENPRAVYLRRQLLLIHFAKKVLKNSHTLPYSRTAFFNNFFQLIHSFSSLFYDRSKASSKASSPHSAIQSLLLQMRVSSPFLKVIQ